MTRKPAQLKRSSGRGFSLVELLVVIAVIAVLSTLVAVAFPRLQERSEATTCLSQMRILGVALGNYLNERNQWPQLPPEAYGDDTKAAEFWIESLKDYDMPPEKWVCPSLKRTLAGSFADAPLGDKTSYHPTPFDDHPGTPTRWPEMPWAIEAGGVHPEGQNMLMLDGRVMPSTLHMQGR